MNTVKTIWCGVGLMLLIIGCVVFCTGLYILLFHIHGKTALANLHPDIWWGSIMIVVGAIFFTINIRKRAILETS
jgi:hypothetical protein